MREFNRNEGTLLKQVKLIVTTSSLVILIIGLILIFNFASRSERPILAILLGASIIICQQITLKILKNKFNKRY